MNMKKIMTLTLAAVMAFSSTSVAFAVPVVPALDYPADIAEHEIYRKDKDGVLQVFTEDINATNGFFKPGEKIYIPLTEKDDATNAEIKRMKPYAEWKVGDSWVSGMSIVYAKADRIAANAVDQFYSITPAVGDPLSNPAKAIFNVEIKNMRMPVTVKTDADKLAHLKAELASKLNALKGTAHNAERTESYSAVATGDLNNAGTIVLASAVESALTTTPGGYTKVAAAGNAVHGGKYYADLAALITASATTGVTAQTAAGWVDNGATKTYYTNDAALDARYPQEVVTDGAGTAHTELYYNANSKPTNGDTVTTASAGANTTKLTSADADGVILAGSRAGEFLFYDSAANARAAVATIGVATKAVHGGLGYADLNALIAATATTKITQAAANSFYKTTDKTYFTDATAAATATTTNGGLGYTAPAAGTMYKDGNKAVMTDKAIDDEIKLMVDGAVTTYMATLTNLNQFTKSTTARRAAPERGYSYFVEIATKSSNTVKDIDLAGDIYVGTSKTDAKSRGAWALSETLTNGKYNGGAATDNVSVGKDEPAIVTFADTADEISIEFDSDARFDVRVSGQEKLNLAYNSKYIADFGNMYDTANINFLTFTGNASFNRTGTLFIYADKDTYIYEVTADGAKAIPGAVYNEAEGAWELRTRSLRSYAISDKKLSTTTSTSTSSSVSGGVAGKPNPDTGR